MDAFYIVSAQKADQIPTYDLPEIAFMGRSNSGKSSLVNSLTGRKNLARHSATPGRTQMINFFGVDNRIILADLPGYGYNVARKEIRDLWDGLVETYVKRSNIVEFIFLMDCRRKFEDFEYEFMRNLAIYTNVSLVLTKADKIKRAEILTTKKAMEKDLTAQGIKFHEIAVISSLSKIGVDELRNRLFANMAEEKIELPRR